MIASKKWQPFWIVSGVWLVSQVLYYSQGITFNHNVAFLWQTIDEDLLRERLLESVFFLHTQPPIFNLFLGIVMQMAGSLAPWVFWAIYLILGLVAALAILQLQRLFRIETPLAVFITSLCILSPSWFLYQNWLFYTFPVMALLCIAPIALYRLAEHGKAKDGYIFFYTFALLYYTRAFFHIFAILPMLVWLYYALPQRRKVIYQTALFPMIFIVGLCLKQLILFGTLTTSTWLGPNLQFMTRAFPLEVHEKLLESGDISGITKIRSYADLSSYEPWIPDEEVRFIPVWSIPDKKGGYPNFNHWNYIHINRLYLKDSLSMIAAAPFSYLHVVWRNYKRFCIPAWNYHIFSTQANKIHPVINTLNVLTVWRSLSSSGLSRSSFRRAVANLRNNPPITVMSIWIPIVLGIIGYWIWKQQFSASQTVVLVFCLFIFLLVLFSGTFLLSQENHRLRFLLTPYLVLFTSVVLQPFASRLNKTKTIETN